MNNLIKFTFFFIFFTTLLSIDAQANIYSFPSITQYYSLDGTEIDNFLERSFENQFRVLVDTNLANQIKQVWNKQEVFYIRILLENYDEDITLSVYNMLGKEVLNIMRGKPKPRDVDYYFNGVSLPNGIYICVLTGKDFKDAKKFVVSR